MADIARRSSHPQMRTPLGWVRMRTPLSAPLLAVFVCLVLLGVLAVGCSFLAPRPILTRIGA